MQAAPIRKANFSSFGKNKHLASVAKDSSPRAHSRVRHEMHSGCLVTENLAVSEETWIPPAARPRPSARVPRRRPSRGHGGEE